jgi:type I restriction enzyme M protein
MRTYPASVSLQHWKMSQKLGYVLTPGRYVGLPDDEDDFDFEERFIELKREFVQQLEEEENLNNRILQNLNKVQTNE